MGLYDYLKEKGFERLLEEKSMSASHAGSDMTLEQLFEGYAERHSKDLQHHYDTTKGLWATDRPDLIVDEKKLMFQI